MIGCEVGEGKGITLLGVAAGGVSVPPLGTKPCGCAGSQIVGAGGTGSGVIAGGTWPCQVVVFFQGSHSWPPLAPGGSIGATKPPSAGTAATDAQMTFGGMPGGFAMS